MFLGTPGTAPAAIYTWTGGDGTSQSWNTSSNWDAAGVPVSASTTDIVFPDSTSNVGTAANPLVQNIASPLVLNSLTFTYLTSTPRVYYLGGSALQFVADGATQPSIVSTNWQDKNFANEINVGASATLDLRCAGYNFRFNGPITGNGALLMTAQSGGGQVFLNSASSTYSGGTTYKGTTATQGYAALFVAATGALGTGPVTLDGGNRTAYHATTNARPGGLIFTGTGTTYANTFSLSSDSPVYVAMTGMGGSTASSATFSGAFDLNSHTLYLRGIGTGTITGAVNSTGGPGALIKMDSGTWVLNGALNYSGGTTINEGTLRLSKGDVAFPATGSAGQFASAHTITVNSGGTLQLGANWVTGDGLVNQVIVNGGTLQFYNSDNYLGNIVLTEGHITTTGGSRPWRTGNWGNGLITVNAGAAPSTIAGALYFVGTAAAPRTTFRVADGAAAEDLVVSAAILDHPGFEGTMMLVKEGPGTMVLSGNNTYAGPTTVSEGILQVQGGSAIPNASNVTVQTGAALWLAGSDEAINALNGGGTVQPNPATGNRRLTVGAGGGSGTFSGTLRNGGSAVLSLTKTGSGAQILTGSLNYTGGTTVDGGILRLSKGDVAFPATGSAGQFGSAHTITVNSGGTLQLGANWVAGDGLVNQVVVNGGTLQFYNSDNYLGNIVLTEGHITTTGGTRPWRTGNYGNGLITVNAGAAPSTIAGALYFVGTAAAPRTTFRVANGAATEDLVVSAAILDHPGFEGTMTLVKEEAGTMVLSGANTYAGPTNVSAGTLLVNGTHTGGATYSVAAGATLGGTGNVSAAVSLAGTMSPGASVGTFTTGTETWLNGGSFRLEIDDAADSPGAGVGWDLLAVNGQLVLSSLGTGAFQIRLVSPSGGTANFSAAPYSAYVWDFVHTTGGIVGFSPDKFAIDFTSEFTGPVSNEFGPGLFAIEQRGDDLVITFTAAVPEPSTLVLFALGLAGMGLAGRRRGRRAR